MTATASALTVAEAARIMRETRREHPGLFTWLYAIQSGPDGPIKIGITNSPATRIVTLQQGNPQTLIGLAAWRDLAAAERQLHREFAHAHIRGEWFQPVPDLVRLVQVLGGDFEDWTL